MLRELMWVAFAFMVVFAPTADASHVVRHNYEYCVGLAQYFYPEIGLAKALDVPKERYLQYVSKWLVTNVQGKDLRDAALEDIAKMYDAADGGEALINKCLEGLSLPNPSVI